METFAYEINSIYVIDENTIWTVSGNSPCKYEDGKWKSFSLAGINSEELNKIWAKDANNVYFVGNKGTIIYYNGSTFSKLIYDANIDFIDVWGDENEIVRAVSFVKSNKEQTRIVKIVNYIPQTELVGQSYPLPISDLYPDYYLSIWWKGSSDQYWCASDNGTFFKSKDGNYLKVLDNANYPQKIATLKLRGNANNDIILAGIFGQVMHWNGKNLHLFSELYTSEYLDYTTLSIKGNVVAVGGEKTGFTIDDQNKAVIAIGKRVIK